MFGDRWCFQTVEDWTSVFVEEDGDRFDTGSRTDGVMMIHWKSLPFDPVFPLFKDGKSLIRSMFEIDVWFGFGRLNKFKRIRAWRINGDHRRFGHLDSVVSSFDRHAIGPLGIESKPLLRFLISEIRLSDLKSTFRCQIEFDGMSPFRSKTDFDDLDFFRGFH
jgi:hypothetical protein